MFMLAELPPVLPGSVMREKNRAILGSDNEGANKQRHANPLSAGFALASRPQKPYDDSKSETAGHGGWVRFGRCLKGYELHLHSHPCRFLCRRLQAGRGEGAIQGDARPDHIESALRKLEQGGGIGAMNIYE